MVNKGLASITSRTALIQLRRCTQSGLRPTHHETMRSGRVCTSLSTSFACLTRSCR